MRVALSLFLTVSSLTAQGPTPIFDGKTLDGWRGDARMWSVEDGAIKGSSMEHRPKANTFLIWEGGEVADFELTFEAKFTPANNSGVQYRSKVFDADAFRVQGYQCDMHPNPPFTAMLYSERERGILARRGQKVAIADGKPKVVGETVKPTPVDVAQWQRYRIVARGNHLLHQLNGVTTVDVTDDHPRASRSGIIALQLHAGAPMEVWFRNLELTRFESARVEAEPAAADDAAGDEGLPVPHWVWFGDADGDEAYFTKSFEVPAAGVKKAALRACADNHCQVWINGKQVLKNDSWESPTREIATKALKKGSNVIAVRGWNDGGPAAVAAQLWIQTRDGKEMVVNTDDSWHAAAAAKKGWKNAGTTASWQKANVLGAVGDGRLVWSRQVGAAAFGARPKPPAPQTVRDGELQVKDGFVSELVYTVPRQEQGSWVSLTSDPKGRLIASDQGGGLYRITPAAIGVAGATTKVERIDVEIGGAQGLLWAFDSLYVMVNGRGSGLYRITDANGDGDLDNVTKLTELKGAGEHGPHAILLSPDGQSLVVCAGNHTHLPEVHASRISQDWQEDLLLPRQWDARGHARGRMAPGGWICKVSPDGSHWEVLSMGYRNEYDIAFNRAGDLFAYDADMEWDMGMPWYRPTRVCHAVSGSEFGWRSGTGKWPTDYPDSLPPMIEIGPGSPTGITFGYGAKFPARYQDALYILDWTFGTMWALHMEPDGASYRATREEFVSGKPLPLTDAVVGADGALYFAVGGRGTQSSLYRIRYTGSDSTQPVRSTNPTAGAMTRRALEKWHGVEDANAVKTAWPLLGHEDRFVAYAARMAIESQPVSQWRERALAEVDPATAIHGLLALAREGEAADRDAILGKLLELDVGGLSEAHAVAALRVYGVAMARHGMPSPVLGAQIVARLDPVLPSGRERVDSELVKVLCFLGSPTIVEKTIPLLLAAKPSPAPAWSELIERNDRYGGPIKKMIADMPPLGGIDLAFSLRNVRYGWTMPLRRAYFEFINMASRHPGGASYAGFLKNCRNDALANCSDAERAALTDLTGEDLTPRANFEVKPPQGPGQAWTVDAAAQIVEGDSARRDFQAGRNLFHAVACASCHRFDGEGGEVGPDLTTVANKFSTRDLLDSIVDPSRVISDQYGSSIVTKKDGSTAFGRVVEQDGGVLLVYSQDPNAKPERIEPSDVRFVKPSPVSQMPPALLNSLNENELRDLIAYLMSRGDSEAPAYRR